MLDLTAIKGKRPSRRSHPDETRIAFAAILKVTGCVNEAARITSVKSSTAHSWVRRLGLRHMVRPGGGLPKGRPKKERED